RPQELHCRLRRNEQSVQEDHAEDSEQGADRASGYFRHRGRVRFLKTRDRASAGGPKQKQRRRQGRGGVVLDLPQRPFGLAYGRFIFLGPRLHFGMTPNITRPTTTPTAAPRQSSKSEWILASQRLWATMAASKIARPETRI